MEKMAEGEFDEMVMEERAYRLIDELGPC